MLTILNIIYISNFYSFLLIKSMFSNMVFHSILTKWQRFASLHAQIKSRTLWLFFCTGFSLYLLSVVFYCPVWSEVLFGKLGILAQQHKITAVGKRLKNKFQTGRNRTFIGLCFQYHPTLILPIQGGNIEFLYIYPQSP